MRFALLGSGSRGNGLVVECGSTCILVDCGFSVAEVVRRLERLDLSPQQLDAILVTHEHGDHARGVGPLSRKYQLPVWLTQGTHHACRDGRFHDVHYIRAEQDFRLGHLTIYPYAVPHDAREPCQFVFRSAQGDLGVLTDSGSITPHIEQTLRGVDALILECNHDVQQLREGPYSAALKARVGGEYGHLSNDQAAQLLLRIGWQQLHHLIVAHISEKNNTPATVTQTLLRLLGCTPADFQIACQQNGVDWCDLHTQNTV